MQAKTNHNKIINKLATRSCTFACIVISCLQLISESGWYVQKLRSSLTFMVVLLRSMLLIGIGIWTDLFSLWGKKTCHGKTYIGRYGDGYRHLIVKSVICSLWDQTWVTAVIIPKIQSSNTLQMSDCKSLRIYFIIIL